MDSQVELPSHNQWLLSDAPTLRSGAPQSQPLEGMKDSAQDWRERHQRDVADSLDFFSSAQKVEREKWVVNRLLSCCAIQFDESDLEPAREPADIQFREARFQVKELMDTGRRRCDEFKTKLRQIEEADSESDLLEPYAPKTISLSEVAQLVVEKSEALAVEKYGPKERQTLDLVFYFNYLGFGVEPPLEFSCRSIGFRSLSVVTNTYCAVLATAPGAPSFLSVGVYLDGQQVLPNAV